MAQLQLDENGLKSLVDAFYSRVRADGALGPIFNDAIHSWPEHLDKLTAFWSSVMLTTGRYKGQPVPAHMKHRSRITPALFQRWLALFRDTAASVCPPEAASLFVDRAERIAQSLQIGIALHRQAS